MSLRLTSVGRIAKPPPRQLERGGEVDPKERRQVFFAESGGYVDCPIYDRYALPAGAGFPGPAVVEEFDSTTIVHPGFRLQVDDTGNLSTRGLKADQSDKLFQQLEQQVAAGKPLDNGLAAGDGGAAVGK